MAKNFPALILFLFAASLAGCGGGDAPSPIVGYWLVTKAHEFAKIAEILISNAPSLYGHALRNIYYSALNLARLKNIKLSTIKSENFHKKIWGISTVKIRKYFEDELKRIRNKYDYQPFVSEKEVVEDFLNFKKSGFLQFNDLLDDASIRVDAIYKNCKNLPASCEICKDIHGVECAKNISIVKLHEIKDIINNIKSKNI